MNTYLMNFKEEGIQFFEQMKRYFDIQNADRVISTLLDLTMGLVGAAFIIVALL